MTDSDPPPEVAIAPGERRAASTPPGTPLSRRLVLAASGGLGLATTAGCLVGDQSADAKSDVSDDEIVERPTVYVFNTGDGTASVIDVEADELVETVEIGMTSSFPSNQFTPRLTDAGTDHLWINPDEGVRALAVDSLTSAATVETGSGANWQERTPDGSHLVVSAREPIHRQYRIDADPGSETFGDVTGEIDRLPEGGRDDHDGPGPCDVTIHPDGEYAYVPDLYGDTLTVIDVTDFEIVTQVDVEPGTVGDAETNADGSDDDPPAPYMGTAAWDGEILLIENDGGAAGSESIWDVSDPAHPEEVVRLGPDDGLGSDPITSEIGPDSAWGYVFTPGTEDVTVLDLEAGAVDTHIDLGGSAFTGTWDPAREKLYVPVQTADTVAVIDVDTRVVTTTIAVGDAPYGATAARVRLAGFDTSGTELDPSGEYDTTYCHGECACGHEC